MRIFRVVTARMLCHSQIMPTQKTISKQAWTELLLLGIIWGGSFLAIRIALDEIGPLTSVAHRTGWAMIALWIICAVMRLALPREPRIWGAFLFMGLLNNVIPFGLMAWGQLYIESGLTSILNSTTAIFGVIAAAFFFADERITLRKGIGVSIGFLGVATAIGLKNFQSFDLHSLAQLAVLGGAVSYALAGIWARRFLGGLAPQIAAAGMLTGSTAITVPLALWFEGPITLDLQPSTDHRYRVLRTDSDGWSLFTLLQGFDGGRFWQSHACHIVNFTCCHHPWCACAQRKSRPKCIRRLCSFGAWAVDP